MAGERSFFSQVPLSQIVNRDVGVARVLGLARIQTTACRAQESAGGCEGGGKSTECGISSRDLDFADQSQPMEGEKKYELANFTNDEVVEAARAVAALGTIQRTGRVPLRRDPSVLGLTTRGPRGHR
jgi:hypothetical protein